MLKREMRAIHPGEILREEVLNAHELTLTKAAKLLGVTRTTVSSIIHAKSAISPEMCFRIAKVFGGSAQIWANLQTKYNLQKAAAKAETFNLKPYHPSTVAK
jgi:addiction module HigA family antidote